MSALSHPAIVDGWFQERSSQWEGKLIPPSRALVYVPVKTVDSFARFTFFFRTLLESNGTGQAMTLRVKKILHMEKSLYQDVLVFESTDHGNVLVLDGAIQCVERDEFS